MSGSLPIRAKKRYIPELLDTTGIRVILGAGHRRAYTIGGRVTTRAGREERGGNISSTGVLLAAIYRIIYLFIYLFSLTSFLS